MPSPIPLPPDPNSQSTTFVRRRVEEDVRVGAEEAVLAAMESETADSSGPDLPLAPGSVLDGRYIVGDVLAEGGMGVVYLGRHVELGQRVAIKFLRREVADRPSVVQRFLNEGRAAASLKSEHVVRVMDVGQLDTGHPYLVMEHLDGTDLDTLLEQSGPFEVDRAIEYALQVCTALGEAHASGIVHRDIKPENLFLVEGAGRPLIKVLDFGLAKRIDSAGSLRLTGPEDSMGSPFYMSPEQITTPQQVDARTDIWSLGVSIYRFLTGVLPFRGDTLLEVYAHVINAAPQPIRTVRPDLDPELEAIVGRCLEKNVEQRYQTILELSRDLSRYRLLRQEAPLLDESPAFVDDTPVALPGVHARWPAAVALLAITLGAAAYAADKTGRVDVRAVSDRLSSALLGSDLVHSVTDGWLTAPRLSPTLAPPMPRSPFVPMLIGPSFGVVTRDPALDASGAVTLSAERELEASTGEDRDADGEAKEQREANYRRYLDQHNLVPLKEALDKLNAAAQAP